MYQNKAGALSRSVGIVNPRMKTSSTTQRRRGRPPAASREAVLDAATYRYLRGRRVDVQAIAHELGLGRTTIYRWFGSREGLIGEVLVRAAKPLLDEARAGARGSGGEALLDTFDRLNRSLMAAPALRRFVEQERDAALRIITSNKGIAHRRMVERIAAMIEAEERAGTYAPPVDPATLAYAIVRLAEAFLFNDAVAGIKGDVDRLRDVEAAILGVRPSPARPS
jgi:AcrR family transcriptional regulator